MTLESDTKFKEKLTCGLEYDMRNQANFHTRAPNVSKLGLLRGTFIQSRKDELRIYRGVMCYDNEE